MTTKIKEYADQLAAAEATGIGIDPLSERDNELTVNDAYSIQLENIHRKLEQGHKIVGKKIGLTSLAMQTLLGVNEPDYGHLLDSMVIENGGRVSIEKTLQPKVEAEIAFVLKKTFKGQMLRHWMFYKQLNILSLH